MSHEHDLHFAEYAKPVAKRGKNKSMRILLILCYILFAGGYAAFFAAITVPQVIALLPVFVWMLVYFTWEIVNYECCVRVESGKVVFLKLKGKKEKEFYSFHARDILFACPYNEAGKEKIAEAAVPKTMDFRADPKQAGYAAVLSGANGTTLIRFECTVAVANAMRYYNKEVLVDKEFLSL